MFSSKALLAVVTFAAAGIATPAMASPMTAKSGWGQHELKAGAGPSRADVVAEARAAQRGSGWQAPVGDGSGAPTVFKSGQGATGGVAEAVRRGSIPHGEQ